MPPPDSTHRDLLITADSHVGETEALRERLPEHLRPLLTMLIPADNGDHDFEYAGERVSVPLLQKLTDRDREMEFR